MDIEIKGMTLAEKPITTAKGDQIIAYFDFRADFVIMRGAALAKLSSGEFTTWEPRRESDHPPYRSVKMIGSARREVASAALKLYSVMSGAEH